MSGTRVVLESPRKFDYGASDLRAEWKRWKRGFSSWLIGAEQDGKKEAVKLNLLLTLLGSEGQDICETFEWPDANRTLEGALERFDSHFAGLSNVTMARFRFFGYSQGDLSLTNFVTGLKSLANDCEFGDLRESLIKDMLVIHCSSEKLRERLLKEPKLNMAKAVEIARIWEDAERNVEAISHGADSGSAGALVAGKRAGQGGGRGTPFRRTRTFDGECFECGAYGHPARDCPDRDDDRRRRPARNRNCSSTSNGRDGNRKTYAGYAAGWALGAAMKGGSRGQWYVDSGASEHMTPDRSCFDWYEPYRKPRNVTLGDGRMVRAYGQGETKMTVRAAAGVALVSVKQVQYVPKLRMSLLSVPATTRIGNEVAFQRRACVVSCGSLRLRCWLNDDGMYEVPTTDDEYGGAPHRYPRTSGCPTPGGVVIKSEHHGHFSGPVKNYVSQVPTSESWTNQHSNGTRIHQVGYSKAEPRTHAGGTSGYQASPDVQTKTGGQGIPGASTQSGTKAGGQGYPGASSRKGIR